MARRRSMYKKKARINYGRLILLVILLIAVVALIFRLFKNEDYLELIDKVMKSDITEISGTMSSVSDVDIKVYSNNGVRYTNQHENIKKLCEINKSENSDKVKVLFENILKSKKLSETKDLPFNENGYYWIDADFIVKDEKMFFSDDERYNFDLYYSRETKEVYVKKNYFSEFSKRNNKLRLQAYEASEEFIKIIDELAQTSK